MNAKAKEISTAYETEAREIEKQRVAAEKAQRAAEAARKEALLAEAEEMEDWDLSGKWKVECEGLANYFGDPRELTMKIFRDEFDPTKPRIAHPRHVSDMMRRTGEEFKEEWDDEGHESSYNGCSDFKIDR